MASIVHKHFCEMIQKVNSELICKHGDMYGGMPALIYVRISANSYGCFYYLHVYYIRNLELVV